MKKKILVIGGGFFGMYISEYLALKGEQVILFEKEGDFMQRASYVNQARVHNGYHYPRSILTGLRSRISLPKFYDEFNSCIDDTFDKYYMISKIQSKISARQFEEFCKRIGAACEPAPPKITNLVDPTYIEATFTTKEFAFDSKNLKKIMLERIESAGVELHLNQKVDSVATINGKLLVNVSSATDGSEFESIVADHVFNCTYSMINQVITDSNLEVIPLKHEMTEMAIVDVPHELKNAGITVMDGPFFSVMPFPSKGLHSFSHVRYTPHYEWYDNKEHYRNAHKHYKEIMKKSAYSSMLQDAKRFMPILYESTYIESIWELITILPRREANDARPILFKLNHGIKGLHSIMGGKIDNVYDVVEVIERTGLLDG